jgi:hypothetical protein
LAAPLRTLATGSLLHELSETWDHDVLRHDGSEPHWPGSSELSVVRIDRGLAALAAEARKPLFRVRPADGAAGSQQQTVLDAYAMFRDLAVTIAARLAVELPLTKGRAT